MQKITFKNLNNAKTITAVRTKKTRNPIFYKHIFLQFAKNILCILFFFLKKCFYLIIALPLMSINDLVNANFVICDFNIFHLGNIFLFMDRYCCKYMYGRSGFQVYSFVPFYILIFSCL